MPARPEVLGGSGLTVWPVQQMIDVRPGQSGDEKTIRAFGFLSRTAANTLVLELPHDREDAAVVTLRGELAERELGPRATAGVPFTETSSAKGAPDAFMMPLLGPGHRPIPGRVVVASSVVVAVEGKARFLGIGPLPHDNNLRGTTYELDVASVERVLDRTTWGPIEARHVARLGAAQTKIVSSDFEGATDELEASVRRG